MLLLKLATRMHYPGQRYIAVQDYAVLYKIDTGGKTVLQKTNVFYCLLKCCGNMSGTKFSSRSSLVC